MCLEKFDVGGTGKGRKRRERREQSRLVEQDWRGNKGENKWPAGVPETKLVGLVRARSSGAEEREQSVCTGRSKETERSSLLPCAS